MESNKRYKAFYRAVRNSS